ncbi:MAG TPA: hypothetical protein VFP84_08755 [Kofleriaceae bacterium]|nr:hypothetical protein [Kofleriaceae bacterium]
MLCSTSRVWFALLCCAACGKVGSSSGQLPDAAAGGAGDEQTRGTVHVTVLDPAGTGNPASNADVVFVDPGGAVHRVKTDLAGKASAEVAIGASLTTVVMTAGGNGPQYQLYTVLDTRPDDDITLGMKSADTTTLGTFSISFPALANAAFYSVSSPCGSLSVQATAGAAPSAGLPMLAECKQDTMELVIVARDGNGAPLGSIDVPDVKVKINGTFAVSGPYQGLVSLNASYANVNPVITKLQVARFLPDENGVVDAALASSINPTTVLGVTGGAAAKAHILTTAGKSLTTTQLIHQDVPGNTVTYGFDLSTKLLPWLALPTYDVDAHKIIVPIDTTGTSHDATDLFQTGIRYSRTDANNTTAAFAWTVYGASIADVTLPALPDDLAALLPIGSDSLGTSGAVAFDAASVPGYDTVRQAPTAAIFNYTGGRLADPNVRITRNVIFRPL